MESIAKAKSDNVAASSSSSSSSSKKPSAPQQSDTISAKDLKAAKKAEKAARRAAMKAEQGGGGDSASLNDNRQQQQQQQGSKSQRSHHGSGSSGSNNNNNNNTISNNERQKGGPSGGGSGVGSRVETNDQLGSTSAAEQLEKIGIDNDVALFRHLEPVVRRRLGAADGLKFVHPAILTLTLRMANYEIVGSTLRCLKTMRAFKHVIMDYTTPPDAVLSRNLTIHLGHQIDALKTARPLSTSMGNAIRWLKQEISTISPDLDESKAKALLCESIDNFIRDRLEMAGRVIIGSAVTHIDDGDVILIYADSMVVGKSLIEAHERGKRFRTIVVDSRPLLEGKALVRRLAKAGLRCQYVAITGLSYVIDDVTTVFLGAHSMLSNGRLYSRVGTALVAMAASNKNIPVIVLCETIKFSDRVQLDAVAANELGSPDDLVSISNESGHSNKEGILSNWRQVPHLQLLNVMYDLTPAAYVKKIITEMGNLPPSSVPVIIREYNKTGGA